MSVYDKIFRQHGFSPTQLEIIKLVGKNKIILEVGPSTGYMTRAFLKNDCTIDVVELNKESLTKLPRSVRKVINHSIEDSSTESFLSKDYDFIVMSDVLEHLINPSAVLKMLRRLATDKTKLLVSLPNIASWPMRKQLFFKGNFEYQDSGLLDRTHLHFYSVDTLPQLLLENGWKVEKIVGTIIRLPFEETISKIPVLGFLFKTLVYKNLVEKYKNLSYQHFLIVAHK